MSPSKIQRNIETGRKKKGSILVIRLQGPSIEETNLD
jgi:dihydroxyacid dehydratase/phosphogluconate dehydratase